MQVRPMLTLMFVMATQAPILNALSTHPSTIPFSSNFHQPTPPLIEPAFTANFNQHKWNENISHITSGFWYSSPSAKKVRVDEAFDSTLASSLFDYGNVSKDGPNFFEAYVSTPSFPLFAANLLVEGDAVYAGTTDDPDFGELVKWNILYAGAIPATVLVDSGGTVHGFDYWSPHERTYVITRLFNIVAKEPPAEVFEFPKPA